MDQTTRSHLQRATQDARRLLETEFAAQLEGTFDILPDGTILPEPGPHLDHRQRLVRHKIIETIEHIRVKDAGKTTAEAIDDYLREAAFTFLNRFAALKMLEARGLVQQCVTKGDQSSGFKEFTGLAPGLGSVPDKGYQLYLECLFDELGTEVKILFDRRDSASLLWPRRTALLDLLEILNRDILQGVWGEDETIGWVYQYFNSDDDRRKARYAASGKPKAPQNSRELAVRNQFFTPRYVVTFLTDNTLGRIWYEMRQGQTALKDQCRYLIRRPNELFLNEGQVLPKVAETQKSLSQAERLKQPVYISFRAQKDPRDLRIIDPACGSGHFLLYCFELLLVIYLEAWEAGTGPVSKTTGKQLREDYPTLDTLRQALPGLILRHNLHGIDIDPRCAQIAALALWIRAQRAFNEFGIGRDHRAEVERTNIVVAEPMPGETGVLDEFVKTELSGTPEDKLVGQLVRHVFQLMALAGEAGSLLKIEDKIADVIETAKKQWKSPPRYIQSSLFGDTLHPARQEELRFEVSGITDAQFWNEVESRIYQALESYSLRAVSGDFQRRLFTLDVARGFAFIDLCRIRYDVVLMNPPFGEAAKLTKPYITENYNHSSSDILHAFVDRGLSVLDRNGRTGVISARTGFFLGDSKDWRKNVVFTNSLSCFADLGLGVLDDALVEVAAYVIERTNPNGSQVLTTRHLDTRDKESRLLRAIEATASGDDAGMGVFDQSLLDIIPDHTFAYWAPAELLNRYADSANFGVSVSRVRQGVATADDFRFARLGWEVPNEAIGSENRWQRFSKGGEYSPPYDDIHLLVDWGLNGEQLRAFPGCFIRNDSYYFKPGATYTVRTASAFAGKVLPAGCVFSHNAQSWFTDSTDLTLLSIGYLSCRVPQTFLELAVGSGDIATAGSAARRYTTAVVESVPTRVLQQINIPSNVNVVRTLYLFRVAEFMSNETSCHFVPHVKLAAASSLQDSAERHMRSLLTSTVHALERSGQLDRVVTEECKLSDEELAFVCLEVGVHPTSYTGQAQTTEVARLFHLAEEELMAEAVARHGSRRWFTKKSYYVDRRLEIICHLLGIAPTTVELLLAREPLRLGHDVFVRDIVSEIIGYAFGRWDVRYATGEKAAPEVAEPFARLPVCPPGMLQSEHCLPARPGDVPASYPVCIPWDGIIVDDSNHPRDIERSVREVIEAIWNDRADAIEHEACEILGVPFLREYLSGSAGFFADHLSRYSKSRRQAPIYWPLSYSGGGYTIWLYYPRIRRDTMSLTLEEYAKPKLRHEQKKLDDLRQEAGPEPTRAHREAIEAQESLVSQISAFVEELARVTPLWNPDLNDGVIINYAVLWRMIGHTPWRTKVKECWDALCAGEYDWAHLAMHLWPERAVPKCVQDASLAIAHGLDKFFWDRDDRHRLVKKTPPASGWQQVIDRLVADQTSPAVKAALESLLNAPPLVGAGGGRRGARSAAAPRRRRTQTVVIAEAVTENSSARSRTRVAAPILVTDTINAIKDAISAIPEGASKADILTATGLTEGRWNAAINALLEQGFVTRTGARRGTRYYLAPEAGRTASPSAADNRMEGQH
jgi:hypothetical protein